MALDEIVGRLKGGASPRDFIAEGFPRSSVYTARKKLNTSHDLKHRNESIAGDDVLANLKQERDRLRLEREQLRLEVEIQELQASRDDLPRHIAQLDAKVNALAAIAVHTHVELNLRHMDLATHKKTFHGVRLEPDIDDLLNQDDPVRSMISAARGALDRACLRNGAEPFTFEAPDA